MGSLHRFGPATVTNYRALTEHYRHSQTLVIERALIWGESWPLNGRISLPNRVLGRKINLAHFFVKMYFWASWGNLSLDLPAWLRLCNSTRCSDTTGLVIRRRIQGAWSRSKRSRFRHEKYWPIFKIRSPAVNLHWIINNNRNNPKENVYGAVIVAEPLPDFTRWMQNSAKAIKLIIKDKEVGGLLSGPPCSIVVINVCKRFFLYKRVL